MALTIPGSGDSPVQTNPVKPTDIKIYSNYAVIKDDAEECVLSNVTADLAAGEEVTYKFQKIPKVTSKLSVQYPLPVQDAVNYTVRIDDILRTTSDDKAVIYDEPIVMTLSVRHGVSNTFSDDVIGTVLERLLGTMIKSDGSYRFSELMRGAIEPRND